MIRFDALALAAIMAGAVAGTAFASDLPPEIKMPEVSVKDARGWYVRGDLGYAVNASHDDTTFRTYDSTSGDYSSSRFNSDRFSGDFCRVVFMGTPVRGSQSARALTQFGPARRLLGAVGGQVLEHGVPGNWPFRAQLGLIAGTKSHGLGRLVTRLDGPNDGTVAVIETELEGATDRCVLPVSHLGMCFSPLVSEQIAAFLDHGHFDRPQQDQADRSR